MNSSSFPLTFDDAVLDPIFAQAHTTRRFTPEPVPVEVIRQVYDHIRWAPTMMNSQPLRLTLLTTPETRGRVADLAAGGNRDAILNAPLSIVAAMDPDWHHHIDRLNPRTPRPGKPTQFEKLDADPEFRTTGALGSVHLQIGYLIVGLRARGLVVGTMTGYRAGAIDELLHATTGWKTQMILNVGWSADHDDENAVRERAPRLEFSEISQER